MSDLQNKFKHHFGNAPTVGAKAPGRLEILGNHTDYNLGFVLSCAVGNATEFVLRPIPGKTCRVKDFRDGSEASFKLDAIDHPVPGDWSNYVRGMITRLRARGFEIGAFEAGMESSVPLSAGMSSSAAFEIAAGFALGEAFGVEMAPAEWARTGQEVENLYLGLQTGLLDQFSSIFGRENEMIMSDFRTAEVLRTVPLPAGYSIVVVNTMKKHNLVSSEYNKRRLDCERAAEGLKKLFPEIQTLRDVEMDQLLSARPALGWREYRRALHVIGECTRVKMAEQRLAEGDVSSFGRLWFESHESSRMNFENSTGELDYLVELAQSVPGCLGARLSGGGFGGITIHLTPSDGAEEYAQKVCEGYRKRTRIKPEYFICSIGAGASSWQF